MAEQLKKFDSPESIREFISLLLRSDAWLSLQDKTQVFNVRVSDKVKTRGSHSSDVGRIARRLASGLTTDKTVIRRAELMGLLHDLGHIPFGHAGEAVADSIIKSHEFSDEEKKQIGKVRESLFGKSYNDGTKTIKPDGTVEEAICFEHNENSVLRFIMLCHEFGYEVDDDIILGILAHSTSRYLGVPKKLDQQAVRLADKLAYINYDVSDLLISFEKNPEVSEALDMIYGKKLTVKNPTTGKDEDVKIIYQGREITMYDFVHLSAQEKIDLFMNEAIKDAKEKGRLTGCNDLVVEIAQLAKKKKRTEKKVKKLAPGDPKIDALKQEVEELKYQIDVKYYELYQRNPILYAAYILKERTDDFIRAGVNLPIKVQIEKTSNAESAVGNKDLEKEFIYKQLASIIEKNLDLDALEKNPEYTPEEKRVIREFVTRFKEYKEKEDAMIKSRPGNTEGVTYPLIYSIVNFIGTYTNTELDRIAEKLNITKRFQEEVLPKLRALLQNPDYYDQEKGVLTGPGFDEREKIVLEYGAIINLRYGMEEESMAPSTADEVIDLINRNGFIVDTTETVAERDLVEELIQLDGKSEEQKLEEFKEMRDRMEQEFIEQSKQAIDSMNSGRQM